jgi:glycogen debranching enzyme
MQERADYIGTTVDCRTMPKRKAPPPPPLDIRDVVTIKHDRVFLLSDRYGDIPEGNTAALGLYFRDTRFLARYELLIDGVRPLFLHCEADRNYSMIVETTLPSSRVDPAGVEKRENVGISRQRWLEDGMREIVKVSNFGAERRRVRLDISFGADFRDLFEVRGFTRTKSGTLREAEISKYGVTLSYEGADGVVRSLEAGFDPAPKKLTASEARYDLLLEPQTSISVETSFRPKVGEVRPVVASLSDLEHEYSSWRKKCTRFRVSNGQLQLYLDRAVLDLRMMQTDQGDGTATFDAGVPWFSTLFGRDALITAYQALTVGPDLAKGTLARLAALQGSKVDEWRDEEPGKIMHEIRSGELAATGEIPHTPYYGTIDATPLWLVLYGAVFLWTGDREFAEKYWPNALRCLEWIDRYGDADGDGYVEYRKKSAGGLDNQGWKDSRDGILHADGSLPDPPIALCEVQGYVYDGKVRTAKVARALGHTDVAVELEEQARKLKERFNNDFWMPEAGFYAVALDGNKDQCRSITSNPGHCLWSRIVDDDKAPRVVRMLLSADLSSGWGVRTLSKSNPAYDPIGYHTGSVWPHDNSIIAHGVKFYGMDHEANRLIDQISIAGAFFPGGRFPELFCGFSREEVPRPVEYPVACRPQAWATGAPLLMVRSYAGINADAPNNTLSVVRPMLPPWLERSELIGMRVGNTRLDLAVTTHENATGVQVLRKDGDLEILIRY